MPPIARQVHSAYVTLILLAGVVVWYWRQMMELSFKPFDDLSDDELRREEKYWWHMAQNARPGSLIEITAYRHMNRCLETLRSRP